MAHLYELTGEYKNALAVLEDIPADSPVVQDTLEGIVGEWKDKAVAVSSFILNQEAEADAIEEAIKRMEDRMIAIRHRAGRVREYLLRQMQESGIQKIECPYFKAQVKKNPSACTVFDSMQIPEKFLKKKEVVDIDKKAIKAAILLGEDVPGAKLTRTERLEIK